MTKQKSSPGTVVSSLKKKSFWRYLCDHRASYILLLPFMTLFFIFTVIPVISSMGLGLTYFNMLEPPKFVGFMNFERMLLDDEVFLIVLKNTLIFAIITGPIGYLISFFSAWLINELGKTLRTVMTFIFYAPVLSGNMYFIWGILFSGDRYGLINSLLMRLGMIRQPLQWLSDTSLIMPALIVIQLWLSLGTGFLAFIAGFQGMDKSLFEAGAIDGIRNRWQELWYITIPSMSQIMLFSAVMQIDTSFGVGSIVQALAGFPTTEYCADTIITYIADVGTVRFEMGYASAIAVFLFLMMLLTNFLISHILSRFSKD